MPHAGVQVNNHIAPTFKDPVGEAQRFRPSRGKPERLDICEATRRDATRRDATAMPLAAPAPRAKSAGGACHTTASPAGSRARTARPREGGSCAFGRRGQFSRQSQMPKRASPKGKAPGSGSTR